MADANLSAPKRVPLTGFLAGVWCTQFVNSALHLAQPLLLAKISGSLGDAAFFSAFDTAVHMFGTFLGGWPTDRFGARRILIVSTGLRAVALALIPIFMAYGILTLWWAMIWYTLDALVRGFVDASVHTLPLELAEHQVSELDRLNSRYEFVFELAGVAGPLMLGALMIWMDGITAHIIIPLGFVLSALAYTQIPARSSPSTGAKRQSSGGSWAGLKTILAKPSLLLPCLGLMSFNIYPLRKLLGAFFAKAILGSPAASGPVGSAFALGGLVGAVIYSRRKTLSSGALWIAGGAAGTIVLALGWIPGSLALMLIAVFVFSLTNVGARLSLTRTRQEQTPLSAAGGVTAASQFGANIVSVIIKAMVGAAFTIGAGPSIAFALVGVLLFCIAIGQFILARLLSKTVSLEVPNRVLT